MTTPHIDLHGPNPSEDRNRSRRTLLHGGVAATGAGLLALTAATPAMASDTENGVFFSFGPTRIFDSRAGDPRAHTGTSTLVPITGFEGDAFFVNVTITATEGSGFLCLYDADRSTRPTTSTINWQKSQATLANFAVVPIGVQGFKIFCGGRPGASTNVIIDVVGYATPARVSATQSQKQKGLQDRYARLNQTQQS